MSRSTPSRLRIADRTPRHLAKKRPDRSCVTEKVRYRDHTAAVSALHTAATARYFAELAGAHTRRRETRIYSCALCRGFHLTSTPDLAAA